MYDQNVVVEMDIEGTYLGDFVSVPNPSSVLFHQTLSMVAISTGAFESASVMFFPFGGVADAATLRVPLTVDDAESITLLSSVGFSTAWAEAPDGPRALSMGENEDELFVTTDDEILRLCWGGTACVPSKRNAIVNLDGYNLKGADVLRAKEALLVCESRAPGHGSGVVRLCR